MSEDYRQKFDKLVVDKLAKDRERGLEEPLVHFFNIPLNYDEVITPTAYTEINGKYTFRLDEVDFRLDENGEVVMIYDKESDWWAVEDPFSEIVVALANFCGCACHDDAVTFFFKQLRDFKKGKDYFLFPGGMDYFKLSCYESGIFDSEFNFTDRGLFLSGLAAKLPEGVKTDEQPRVITLPTFNCSEENKAEALKLLTAELKGDIPNGIDKDKILGLLYFLCDRLVNKDDVSDEESLYNYRETNPGETTMLLYWLDEIFDLEEHGGSTPGWFAHDKEPTWEKVNQLLNSGEQND